MSSTDFKEQFLKNNQPPIFVKLLAMLSLVRWYNVLLVTIGLYLSSIFMLQDHISKIDVIKDISLHINILAIAFLIMAGYIINAFYDFEKDLINHPESTVFGTVISKQFCLNSYIFFLFLAIFSPKFWWPWTKMAARHGILLSKENQRIPPKLS